MSEDITLESIAADIRSMEMLERDFKRLLEIANALMDEIDYMVDIDKLDHSTRDKWEEEISDMEVRAADGRYGAAVRG